MQQIRPPVRYLMGPGPSPVEGSVLAAMGKPVVGHLDPEFIAIMDEIAAALRQVFRTANHMTFPVSGTGSAGMEAAIVNLVEPGDRVVIAVCGVFGARMAEVATRAGAEVTTVEAPWGEPVPTDEIARVVDEVSPKVVGIVHAETSTGVRQPVEELRSAIGPFPLLVVDTVTSLAGIEVDVDAWGIDVAYSGTQKCLSVPPGLAPITFSDRAVETVGRRTTPVQSWYLDVSLLAGYWEGGSSGRRYHHTAPISMMYGLHEGLRLVLAEGLEARWRRHAEAGRFLQSELQEMGFVPVPPEAYRLPQLTSVFIPDGVDDAALRSTLLHDHGIEVGGGLGQWAGKAWRIGMMGAGARREAAIRLVQALRRRM
jgi:alanine-glyoxylate transaminase / serine-glyoxylate transaminase / serine-pyruvate transaminase